MTSSLVAGPPGIPGLIIGGFMKKVIFTVFIASCLVNGIYPAEMDQKLSQYLASIGDNEIEITSLEDLSYFDYSLVTVDFPRYEAFDFTKPYGENMVSTFQIMNYDKGLAQMFRIKGKKYSFGATTRNLNGSYTTAPDTLLEYTFNVTNKRTFEDYQQKFRNSRFIPKRDLENLFRSFEYTAAIKTVERGVVLDERAFTSKNYRELRIPAGAEAALAMYNKDRPVYLHNFEIMRNWVLKKSWNDPFLTVAKDADGLFQVKIESRWVSHEGGYNETLGNYSLEYEYSFTGNEYLFSYSMVKERGPYSGEDEKGLFSYSANELLLQAAEIRRGYDDEWVKAAGDAARTKRLKYTYKNGVLTIEGREYKK